MRDFWKWFRSSPDPDFAEIEPAAAPAPKPDPVKLMPADRLAPDDLYGRRAALIKELDYTQKMIASMQKAGVGLDQIGCLSFYVNETILIELLCGYGLIFPRIPRPEPATAKASAGEEPASVGRV